MKMNKLVAVALLGAACVACGPKGGNAEGGADSTAVAKKVNPKDLLPTKAEVDTASYLLGVNFGAIIKGNNFGDLNMAQIKKGMNDMLNSKGEFQDEDFGKQFKVDPARMNEILNAFLEKKMKYTAAVNLEAGEKFLAENAKKDSVVTCPSGLQYKIISEGTGVCPTAKDTVSVNYKGTLIDGKVFDQSSEGRPVTFPLGNVIKGWTEGFTYFKAGTKAVLYIPANLAYGEYGNRGIDPNSTLIFEVELLEVKPFVEKVAEPAPAKGKKK